MKKKILTGIILILPFLLLLLTGCGSQEAVTPEVSDEPKYPAGAIFPVWEDERAGIKSRHIELTDFTFTIPDGYVYGMVENADAGYTVYYVWKDKEDKEYVLALDGDIMMYIYDGLDKYSLHKELSDGEAHASISGTYMGYLSNLVEGWWSVDPILTVTEDEKYYVNCFTGYSGEYISTTYSVMCYPKTYYGIYTLQKETETYDRQFYGFVFSNDDEGEIFKKSEYTYLLNEIKDLLNIEEFYSLEQINYDPAEDFSKGRTYDQMLTLFQETYLYYVDSLGKPYERENVDVDDDPEAEFRPAGEDDVSEKK